MVVSDRYKYVYIPVMKTGSQAVSHWLCLNYRGKHVGSYHEMEVPAEYQDYLVWTIVRNPYERCYSWWWMDAKEPREKANPDVFGLPFVEYMHRHIERKMDDRWRYNSADPNYSMTQTRVVQISKATHVIRYESMKEGLAELPFIKRLKWPIASRNKSPTRPQVNFREYFSDNPKAEETVWEYCQEDFETFGYQRHQL